MTTSQLKKKTFHRKSIDQNKKGIKNKAKTYNTYKLEIKIQKTKKNNPTKYERKRNKKHIIHIREKDKVINRQKP